MSCHNLFVCRRICRRSTDLVLFRLAGAFPAEPPLIWCCSVWPAHSPPIWSLHLPAHLLPTHRFGVAPFGWLIPSLRHHCLSRLAHPIAHFFAGASHCRTTIAHFGRRIPSPRHHCLYRLAHPLAMPPSLFLAGASPRHATIAYLGWRIPSPCLHRLSLSAHPITAPPYRISAGASHRRTTIAYLSVCALTRCHTASGNFKVMTFFTPAPPPHQY